MSLRIEGLRNLGVLPPASFVHVSIVIDGAGIPVSLDTNWLFCSIDPCLEKRSLPDFLAELLSDCDLEMWDSVKEFVSLPKSDEFVGLISSKMESCFFLALALNVVSLFTAGGADR